MNDAIEFVRGIRHCAEPWTWNLLQEDGEITYSPNRDARTGWIRYKCKTAKAFTEVLETLEYCRGCFSCMRNGGTCVHHDDMRVILESILQSDLLLLSFPLHCYGVPAPLKALMDRTLPLSSMAMQRVGDRYEHVGQADFSHIRYLMVCGCGFPNSTRNLS